MMSGTDLPTRDSSNNESNILFHIIGLGVSEKGNLTSEALNAFDDADVVLGSPRQIRVVEHLLTQQETHYFPSFSELPQWLDKQIKAGAKQIAILASGDPLYFGIGRWFSKQFSKESLRFYPAVSSIQAACHKVGLSLQNADVISLHGRPVASLIRRLKQHQNIVVLTDYNSRPQVLAEICKDMGLGHATLHVCERLGYADEKVSSFKAADLVKEEKVFDDLHVSIIQTRSTSKYIAEFPGVPDTEFVTDKEDGKGMLTKREVRLNILSMLQARRKDVVWDIGAGCGSVAVELAFWQEQAQIYAIEHHDERLGCLNANRMKFGVEQNLNVIEGYAPEVLTDLPKPNKVFIGGSDGQLKPLLALCWQLIPLGGVLVASAVTETTKLDLMNFIQDRSDAQDAEFESSQLLVSRSSQLADQLLYRPNFPVTLFKWTKTS